MGPGFGSIEIGHFGAWLALILTFLQLAGAVHAGRGGGEAWLQVARRAAYASFLALTLAGVVLVVAFVQHDFSVRYVAEHSSLRLPLFYLLTALWGGHEGSLFFWGWLLSCFMVLVVWRSGDRHDEVMPWVLAVLAGVLIGFLLLILFLSTPFARLFPAPADGRDLNPLLQDPGMVLHPPFLYMGYVGFAIPYAFAMASMITGKLTDEWVTVTRRWTLFAWAMLTIGIVFGAYWAYYELGWGGYWAWDPVENASFMPWLTGTALFHSVMVQERRLGFRVWNLFLVIVTFSLSLLGTFLVRSGVLSSVHAFATDPGRGVYLLLFMTVVLLLSFSLLIRRSGLLQTEIRLQSLFCRESLLLFNNLFFVVAAATVLLGTLYPLAVETLTESKVSVGAPYFNKVFVPIMLGVILLMGIAPSMPWVRMSSSNRWERFRWPLVGLLAGGGIAWWVEARHPYGVVAIMAVSFVVVAHVGEVVRAVVMVARRDRTGLLSAFGTMVQRNRRRYGGLLTHIGIVCMVLGFLGTGLFQQERDLVMKPGEHTRIGAWQLEFVAVNEVARDNWRADEALFRARRDGAEARIIEARPQKRNYAYAHQPTTEAFIHSSWREDLYVVLGDRVSEHEENWGVRLYVNPMARWIWWGSLVMGFGVLLSLLHRQVPSPTGTRQEEGA
jgi:cytochrome c-type biogenesis protein CcmF